MGSAISLTEFVSAHCLLTSSPKSIDLFRYTELERPIIFQVFGSDAETITQACEKVLHLKPDGFDLNIGCSVKKVAMKGAGAGLLKEPKRIQAITASMVRNLKVPISAKIRLGWDENSQNYLEVAKILESEGIWLLSVHGRTRSMGYTGQADWDAIGELKSKVSLPVLGNGDIQNLADAYLKIDKYNLNGALIGRASIGNPWIFSGKPITEISHEEWAALIVRHKKMMIEFYGDVLGRQLFRKHLKAYLNKKYPHKMVLFDEFILIESMEEFAEKLMSSNS